MNLVDTIPDVRYWSKIPSPPDLEVKITDLEFFVINEMSISHQSVIRIQYLFSNNAVLILFCINKLQDLKSKTY